MLTLQLACCASCFCVQKKGIKSVFISFLDNSKSNFGKKREKMRAMDG